MSALTVESMKEYYKAPGDYPEIKVCCKNQYYANLLLKDYAGFTSELTAITTYVQNHIAGNKNYELAVEAFRGVSMVEMEHLEILGDTITALGGFPEFAYCERGKKFVWDGSNVPGTCKMEKMLEEAIDSEYAAIDQYYAHIDAIDDHYVCDILARIAEDEKYHIRLFKKLLRSIC